VLQENEFERVGGSQTIRVNVRVIAATNRDLEADVAAQKFRADLFYRLNVFPVRVPPLRERQGDLPLLVAYFVTQLSGAIGKRVDEVEPASMERLTRYSWPGNIRELRNVLERAIILCDGPVLKIGERELPGATPSPAGAPLTLAEAERAHILSVLELTKGVIGGPHGAAKVLGVAPSTLRSTMERLDIKA
jgi:transcriptional regulator with GAF, ATPase, and Fis domain